jgi:hypothetical protein
MLYLKQSTASQEVPLGPFVDDADGDTQMTALTIANTDIKVWKNGATTLANKNSGGATHISGGIYYAVLDATDTDTLGPLVLYVHVADALPIKLECCVLAANVYDSFVAATDKLQVDTVEISSDQTAADNLELAVEDTPGYIRKGTAQAGAAGTITLDASANANNDFYNGTIVLITGGTGVGQARIITDYVGATKVASVGENFITVPDSSSTFVIYPGGNAVADVNVVQISGDSVAADNLEAACDGTGYNLGAGDIVVDSVAGDIAGNLVGDVQGTIADLKQALYMLTQFMLERSISGTTMTVRKVDGTTALFTLTLNDGTTPTSITRAT